uniref:Uncharacterized protein n=1 Tax=viral metagenome TaxID=1070528 RepID=A0A6C0J516_9ZZZZ
MSEKKAEENQLSVSPLEVILGSIDLATSRGAFRMQELQLISQAYAMITQTPVKEQAGQAGQAGQDGQAEEAGSSEQGQGQGQTRQVSELERAIQGILALRK